MAAIGTAVVLVAGGTAAVLLLNREPPPAGPENGTGKTPAAATGSGGGKACEYLPDVRDSQKKTTGTPPSTTPASLPVRVTLRTNLGSIVVRLDPAKAPCTVNSFHYLAGSGYYTNTTCHRLTTAATLRVLQCGDPTGTGSGGPSYRYANENASANLPRGTVAMANSSQPDSNGGQFFIVYGDVANLPAGYPVFGSVTGGLDIVDGVAAAGTVDGGEDGRPKRTITIRTIGG